MVKPRNDDEEPRNDDEEPRNDDEAPWNDDEAPWNDDEVKNYSRLKRTGEPPRWNKKINKICIVLFKKRQDESLDISALSVFFK